VLAKKGIPCTQAKRFKGLIINQNIMDRKDGYYLFLYCFVYLRLISTRVIASLSQDYPRETIQSSDKIHNT